MPIYDLRCPTCDKQQEVFCRIDERDKQRCICGAILSVLISTPNYIPFHGGWHPNIALEPIYIKSKRQLQHECQKRGLTSMYVEGSTFSEV